MYPSYNIICNKGPPYVPLFNTRMRECRDVYFIFRAASLPQYTLVTGNAASRFANRILSNADPNLREIPSRIADQGYHVRASSVGSNEFFFGNLCPLCHRPRVNPAASTSGYVFCYRCIILHLREKGEYCPLTGVACPQSRVVRLFEETGASSGEAPATLLPR